MKTKKDAYCYECLNDPCSGKHQQRTQHTPTPWEVQGGAITSLTGYSESWNKQVPPARHDTVVATINQHLENWDSNAAFIVRAVNAHEELVLTLEHIESWLRDSFFDKDEAHCLQKAYEVAQAIAKAEGRE